MGSYKLTVKAETDFAKMYYHGIITFGLKQARAYYNSMHDTLQLLAENKNLGRDASEYIEDLLRFTYKVHTIFYLIIAEGILVIRVLSQRTDYESKLVEQ